MAEQRSNAPRRYFIDGDGRRVLIGLTLEETFEFERLEGLQAPSLSDSEIARDGSARWLAAERRWQELYTKHEDAWRVWMVQNPIQAWKGFSFY